MHESVLSQHEAVAAYSDTQVIALTQAAQDIALRILDAMEASLKPGMTETEFRTVSQTIAAEHDSVKAWHAPYLYFGTHSTLTFRDKKPDEDLILQDNDIVTLDIGPLFHLDGREIEGDVGRTVVIGNNPLFHQLKQASEEIFQKATEYWREQQPTGVELYQYVHRLTKHAGFIFHLEPAGHLIGSFPHKGWKEGLSHYPFTPEPGIWILEVQLRHPTEPYGAFYEAVLV